MPTPATYREVLGGHDANTGRNLWNLTQQELVPIANYLLDRAEETWRGAAAPALSFRPSFREDLRPLMRNRSDQQVG